MLYEFKGNRFSKLAGGRLITNVSAVWQPVEPRSPTVGILQQKVDEAGKRVEAVIAQRAPAGDEDNSTTSA